MSCLDSLKNGQRCRSMIGWKAVADGSILRETQPGRWSLVLFVQRRCSDDATPHFMVLAHWLVWTEDVWGTPDTDIVSPKCPFSTWRELPPKYTQLLWILCPNLHTYQGRWTWVAGIKLEVDTMTITYFLLLKFSFILSNDSTTHSLPLLSYNSRLQSSEDPPPTGLLLSLAHLPSSCLQASYFVGLLHNQNVFSSDRLLGFSLYPSQQTWKGIRKSFPLPWSYYSPHHV